MPTTTPITAARSANANGRSQTHPTAKVERVTPEKAVKWLEANTHNRRPKDNKIDVYRAAMLRGEWRLTGEAIKFAKDGTLLDGQNRLWAVVRSGVTIDVLVVRGLDFDTQVVMDTGASRQFSDQLALNGEKDARALASALRLLFFYENSGVLVGGPRAARSPTAPQLFELLDRHPDIRDYTAVGQSLRRSLGGSTGVWTLLHYLFSRVDQEDADAFMFQVKTGLDLHPGDPALALRNVFLKWKHRPNIKASTVPAHVQAAWTIKTFNKFRAGETMDRVVFKPTVEDFPEISTVDYSG